MTDERTFLTVEQATALLPDGDTIHVFLNPNAAMLIGADWSRKEIIELLSDSEILEVGGEACLKMGHGLVALKNNRYHFIESSAGKIKSPV